MPGRLRLTLRVAAIAALTAVCVPLHWGAVRFRASRSPWPRRYLRWTGRIVGARVRVEGRPLSRDVVFVSNHLSPLDILVLAGASGTAFVAMSELEDSPVVGALCDMNNTLYVNRADRAGVTAQIETIRRALTDGWPVTLFAEGTPGDGRTLAPFKPALLGVLTPPPPGVRVQPVALDYEDAEEIAWTTETGWENTSRLFARAGRLPVTVRFLDPLSPEECRDRKSIAAAAHRAVSRALGLSPVGPDTAVSLR